MLTFFSQMLGLSKPKNGLNGFHPEPEAEPDPLLKQDYLPEPNGPQPVLFAGVPAQAVASAEPLPLIEPFILENITRVVTKYINKKWPTVNLAFADEIATLKQDAKYQGQPSLADDPEKSRTIDFIQAAYPAINAAGARDQLAIDVVSAYSRKNRAQFTSLFKVCDIIAGVNTLDKFASQMKKAADAPRDEAVLATFQDSYYQQALILQKRLQAHSHPKIKKQSGILSAELVKAFPEISHFDLPQPRISLPRKCKPI